MKAESDALELKKKMDLADKGYNLADVRHSTEYREAFEKQKKQS
jgi:hypothetical protein